MNKNKTGMHPRQGIADLAIILERLSVRDVVISAGARSFPIVSSLVRNKALTCVSVVDERSAAYFAAGLSLHSGAPTVLVCTSGTASLNYAPGIAEAYYQQVPLLVVTADRPPEWIDQRDNQTIRQTGIYQNYIHKSFIFPVATLTPEERWHAHRMVSEAIAYARHYRGPVHLNVPLREPLFDELPPPSRNIQVIERLKAREIRQDAGHWYTTWTRASKKMILLGQHSPDAELNEVLNRLSGDPSLIICGENLSNMPVVYSVQALDRLFYALDASGAEGYVPDVLITTGGSIVSKQVKQFFRNHPPEHHWHLSRNLELADTFMSLSHSIETGPAAFLRSLEKLTGTLNEDFRDTGGQGTDESPGEGPGKTFRDNYLSLDNQLNHIQQNYLESAGFCDLKAFRIIHNFLHPEFVVHLGNSTPVRYSQLFENKNGLRYYANRGVSGIDGCVSTAAGFARGSDTLNLMICGDLTFLYDSNVLWMSDLPANLRIIVINNNGGDVFTMIGALEDREIYPYIRAPQQVSMEYLVKASGLHYWYADDEQSLEDRLNVFLTSTTKAGVLEINTREANNTKIVNELYNAFKNIQA